MSTQSQAEVGFAALTPDRILDAVEQVGVRCTGRVLPLHCMENRVYELEIEVDEAHPPKSPSERFVVAKFYRPWRWTPEQIADEHAFLADLEEDEIPVVAPRPFPDGTTLRRLTDAPIWFAVFPKAGGRSPDELDDEGLRRLGRLLARMHAIGGARPAPHRVRLDPDGYGRASLEVLRTCGALPPGLAPRYEALVETICAASAPAFATAEVQRVHGDCHLGNILWNDAGPRLIDFDDMVRGPCVQDVWLPVLGRDAEARRQRGVLLEAYEVLRPFDYRTLALIEPLRALRMVHFSAWIAKRWSDPAFPHTFPQFGTERWWQDQIEGLAEVRDIVEGRS
ncbi:MAG: serine/threonine protein kinase [Deltaproteobacteria bacterium]|nr:serine/threonine protein kinase [Deltaproteobacteria bacterium]